MKFKLIKMLVLLAAVFGMNAYAGTDTYDLGKFTVVECADSKGQPLFTEWFGNEVSVEIHREGERLSHEDVVSYRIGDKDKSLTSRTWKKELREYPDSRHTTYYTTPQFFNYPDFGRIEVESVNHETFCDPGYCFPQTRYRSSTWVAFKIENQELKFSSTTVNDSYDYFTGRLTDSTRSGISCRMTRVP